MLFRRMAERLNVRRLMRDTKGVAAVEFAVIMPVALMLFFGAIEVSTGVAVDRKVVILTRTLSDLISRAQTITDVDINNSFNISSAVMAPYSNGPVKAKISQIYIDPKTLQPKLVWSKGYNVAANACGAAISLPSGLAIGGTYLILSEVSYDYTPVAGMSGGVFSPPTFHLSDKTFTRPRQTDSVSYSAASTCP
ncbi:MAG: pilus assembly protein [Afipia felis]|nr:pilus assembly protein [Afipia felis]